jgi:CBS domain containing-hemolysin-like protein
MPDGGTPDQPPPPAGANRNLPMVVTPPAPEPERATFFSRLARTLFRWRFGSTRDDLAGVLEAAAAGDTGLSMAERTMLQNILSLHERRIDDVMIPRADIVAVQHDIPLGDLLKMFEGAAHSRLVVYNDTLDDPVGMVHIRDLIGFMTARAAVTPEKIAKRRKAYPAGLDLKAIDLSLPLSQAKITRDMLFVPPSMPALDLLAKMQATRIHLALVVDEYGGSDGLVSMEDIVEQIVGDISDEHDEEELPSVVRQPDGSFIADARAPLDDVVAAMGDTFDVGEAAEEVDTIGGYLVALVGRLPLRGELMPGPEGFEIEVLDSDPRRIKRVRIHRRDNGAADRERRRAIASDPATPVPGNAAGDAATPKSASDTRPRS